MILQDDVMAEMNVCHEEVVVSHNGRSALAGRTVNRNVLSKDVIVADLEEGGFSLVFAVLGITAEHDPLRHEIVRA